MKTRETNFTISAGVAEALVKFGSSTQLHGVSNMVGNIAWVCRLYSIKRMDTISEVKSNVLFVVILGKCK